MPPTDQQDITDLLEAWRQGDERAAEALVPRVYGELRKIAVGYLSIERPDHTLQPTALVHEAYLRLVDQKSTSWQSRSHFYGIAARLIRRILVDHARRRHTAKRGGGERIPLAEVSDFAVERPDHLMALDEALSRLAEIDPLQVTVIEHRFFGGLTGDETAEVLGLSPATVKRRWRLAKAWLYREMTGAQP